MTEPTRPVTIEAFPRLHVGLIDLGNVTLRRYGGAGFTLTGPTTEIRVAPARANKIDGMGKIDIQTGHDLQSAVARFQQKYDLRPIRVELHKVPPQHVGLGSKTALLLATLKAMQLAYGLALTKRELQILSERGGTSGIGLNSFFTGGFMIDAGHEAQADLDFRPSHASKPTAVPPLICRALIPAHWHFHLLLPSGKRVHARNERDFFRNNTPIPADEVLSTFALIYHGLAPAILGDNFPLLIDVVSRLQRIGFKQREVDNQTNDVQKLLITLSKNPSCAVGLSSVGPLVYVITEGDPAQCRMIRLIAAKFRAKFLGCQRGHNKGFVRS